VIHGLGFSKSDMEKFRGVLQYNSLQTMQNILSVAKSVPKNYETIVEAVLGAVNLTKEVADAITSLWEKQVVKDACDQAKQSGIMIPSTADYLLTNAIRFMDDTWVPSNEDIFRLKLKTTGIVTTTFETQGMEFTIIDVGGQRAERRKWLHCLDDVSSIIYLASLDEYNIMLEEDHNVNRFQESLKLFKETTGSQYFQPACAWILFLNKSDLLREKIKKEPVNKYFDDISEEDGSDFDQCCKYFQSKYEECFSGKKLYTFVTCALDTSNCEKIFDAIKESILEESMTFAW